MSYILQALKKSQQDRELGQIPTLSTSADGAAPMPSRSINPWSLGALILALTAVLIALYGTFGDRLHRGDQAASLSGSSLSREAHAGSRPTAAAESGPVVARGPVAPSPLAAPEARHTSPGKNAAPQRIDPPQAKENKDPAPKSTVAGPAQPQRPVASRNGTQPVQTARATGAQATGVAAASPAGADAGSGSAPASTAGVIPPAVKESPRGPAAALAGPQPGTPAGLRVEGENAIDYPRDGQAYSEFLRSEAERLRARLAKLDSPPVVTPIEDKKPSAPVERIRPPVRERPAAIRKLPQITPPAGIKAPAERPAVMDSGNRPPLARQLPPDIHRSLPGRQIIAHIYAKDPERRFIILNSTKLREGDQTAEGLILQEVRPDGIVFQFRDHQFFQPR